MMLYDVIAVDFIPELCVFQLNAKLKPSYIPRCGIFFLAKPFCEKSHGIKGSLTLFAKQFCEKYNKMFLNKFRKNMFSEKI